MKRVEIVVLNWNGRRDTERCLESLTRLSPREGYEVRVRVVDNGSTDASATSLPPSHPTVTFQLLPENRRYAGGNNAGVRSALEGGAEFVLLLNNDTSADEALLAELFREVERDPECGLWGPCILDAAGRVWFGGGGLSLALGWTWHRGLGGPPPAPGAPPADTDYLTGCCLLVSRSVFERVGELDEGYFLYAEDADFSLRARRAGYRPRYVPGARLTHFVSSSSGGAVNPFKAYHRTRAGLRLFARHATGWRRWTWPAGFFCLLLAQSVAWTLRGAPAAAGAAWQAVVDHAHARPPGERYPVPAASLREEAA